MGRRGILLVAMIGVALAASSCGRASQTEIEQALGITPTATASAAQIATGTAAAAATTAAQTVVAAAPVDAEPGAPAAAAMGDVGRGSMQFITQCSGCHRAGGAGPDLLSPGGPGAAVTTETLLPLVRDGTGHAVPPGPYPPTLLSDGAVADIAAYIAAQAGG